MAEKPLVSQHHHEADAGWIDVELLWCPTEDGLECASLSIRSSQPLTAMTLKALPLGAMLEDGRWSAAEQLRSAENDAVWQSWVQEAADHRRRRQYGDDHFELVASLYKELRKSTPSKTTSRLAEHFDVDVATARRWVAGARDRGLLEGL